MFAKRNAEILQKHAPHHMGSRCVGRELSYLVGPPIKEDCVQIRIIGCLGYQMAQAWKDLQSAQVCAGLRKLGSLEGPLTLSRKSSPHCGSTSPAKPGSTNRHEDSDVAYSV